MVVRGSCSCYGHASRCLPGLPTEGYNYPVHIDSSRTDMVHGRCECTHNTKGPNCNECEDFHHDLQWKPAIGKQSNACKSKQFHFILFFSFDLFFLLRQNRDLPTSCISFVIAHSKTTITIRGSHVQ